jgi:hypothetical protein
MDERINHSVQIKYFASLSAGQAGNYIKDK